MGIYLCSIFITRHLFNLSLLQCRGVEKEKRRN